MIHQLPFPLQYQARWGDGGSRGGPLSPINNLIQISVLLLGILKKGPDPAGTFKKRANQNISGPHTHLMPNTLSISICALPFYKKL